LSSVRPEKDDTLKLESGSTDGNIIKVRSLVRKDKGNSKEVVKLFKAININIEENFGFRIIDLLYKLQHVSNFKVTLNKLDGAEKLLDGYALSIKKDLTK
jgi:hypothetical protein